MRAKVSIIMPVKNVVPYIHDCIQSIQGQSFTDWELLVVDDHSTDQTDKVLASFQREDSRIHIYPNQGTGIIPALRLALDKAHGEYVTRFDGDDMMPEGRLQEMVSALDNTPPKTIVTGKVEYFGSQPISKGYQVYEVWLNDRIDQQDHWNWIYRECVIASPNWMLRREELIDMDAFASMTYPEDYDLVLNWYRHGFTVRGLETVTLHWREHPHRTSRNSDHYNQQYFFKLKIRHFVENDLGDHPLVLWGTDVKGKLTAQLLDEMHVGFTWMGLENNVEPKRILGHRILYFKDIEKITNPKLLLSIYPSENQRLPLESYLSDFQLNIGRDYWYL
ncbi:hypothetical protein BFP97_02860 [Roseivirga sp. 4D4]|uniref:glycosyltransferase family 2 protein n=1 Tax=Roseivirga sp. 4D4 TaxID=1889784 RepID=UPI00085326AC|nr:glycosyltransferase family A protein [Roseivirga sp. 4D4]OEK00512.1 hypothetical protein BFP97_02860 [Roseivirga sp. 4D4]